MGKDCKNIVHTDETWVYLMNDKEKLWVNPQKEHHTAPKAQIKQFITKVMLLVAVARSHKWLMGQRLADWWASGRWSRWPLHKRKWKTGDEVLSF